MGQKVFFSAFHRSNPVMGIPISASNTMIGYPLSYLKVFEETNFLDKDITYSKNYKYDNEPQQQNIDADAGINENDEVGKPEEEEEEILNALNPHVELKNAWIKYIQEFHPELANKNILPYIGATDSYANFAVENYNCVVVFGHELIIKTKEEMVGNEISVDFSIPNFPKATPEIIRSFVKHFAAKHGVVNELDAPMEVDKKKNRRKEGCDFDRLNIVPEVVTFVGYQLY